MADVLESKSFVLPSEVRKDLAALLKETKAVKSLEFHFKGDDLEGAKQFGESLVSLKKRGVKITHEFSIKLEFPRMISREKALELVEGMPKPVNGSIKARIETNGSDAAPAETKS